MKSILLSFVVTTLVVLTGCADTPEAKMHTASTSGAVIHEPDKVTCKNVVRTGTRIGSKKCMTNRSWAQASRGGREALETVQRQSTMTPTVGGN